MNKFYNFCIVTACLTAPLLLAQDRRSPGQSQPTAVRAARLIDGRNDSPITDAVIIIEGEKITVLGSRLAIPAGSKLLDLGDATLLPGLIDAHSHLLSELDETNGREEGDEVLRLVATQSTAERALLGAKLGREDLEAGITTVRDVGNSGVNGDVALRRAIDRGWVSGPRIVAATRALAAPGGQFGTLTPEAQALIEQEYVTINGSDSARQAVRQALNNGADCIKVIVNGSANVTLAEMKAIVEEAHISGVKVAATRMAKKRPASLPKRQGTSTEPRASQPRHARSVLRGGMTPMEVIHAATSSAAELLGLQDRIGTLEVGKLADIIAVPGHPLKDVTSLEHPRFVMKGGVVIKNEK